MNNGVAFRWSRSSGFALAFTSSRTHFWRCRQSLAQLNLKSKFSCRRRSTGNTPTAYLMITLCGDEQRCVSTLLQPTRKSRVKTFTKAYEPDVHRVRVTGSPRILSKSPYLFQVYHCAVPQKRLDALVVSHPRSTVQSRASVQVLKVWVTCT